MSDTEQEAGVPQDRIVVYTTTEINDPPNEVTETYLENLYPDADYVKAFHGRKPRELAYAGEDPPSYVCPECGEGTWSAKQVDDTWHYYHHEHDDCPLDYPDDQTATTTDPQQSLRARLGITTVSAGIAASLLYGVLWLMPQKTITVNGEAMTIPPTEMVWAAFAVVVFTATILAMLPYLPVMARGDSRV